MKNIDFDKFDLIRIKGIIKKQNLLGPRSINIHITNACGRRCLFCWYYSPFVTKKNKIEYLGFTKLKQLLYDCKEIHTQTIYLEGGEITLYPRIKEIFYLINSLGLKLNVYSHLAFDKKHLEYLKLADLINVNLSAVNEDSYRIIHGKGHFGFNQVVKNLFLISKLKKTFQKTKIILTFIITELNYQEIEKFIRLAEELNVEELRLELHIATKEMKQLVLTPQSLDNLKKIIYSLLNRKFRIKNNLINLYKIINSKSFLKNCFSFSWSLKHNDRYFYYNVIGKNKTNCFLGWFYSFIDEKGQVIAPCDNIGVCIAGNIYEEPFKNIWFNSDKFKKIRDESLGGIDVSKKKWFECKYCGYTNFNKRISSFIKKIHPGFPIFS